jgi:hypothetical protein
VIQLLETTNATIGIKFYIKHDYACAGHFVFVAAGDLGASEIHREYRQAAKTAVCLERKRSRTA